MADRYGEYGEWICQGLASPAGSVTRDEFYAHVKKQVGGGGEKAPQEEVLRGDWTKVTAGIFAAASALGVPGISRDSQTIKCAKFEPARYASANFRAYVRANEKEKIGRLVANRLQKLPPKSLFFGSGTSVLWVGRAMSELKGWNQMQQVNCINLMLLAAWSEPRSESADHASPPMTPVKIPEGLYDPGSSRYTTMEDLRNQQGVGISIVGADGCEYKAQKSSVYLFATSDHVGRNTIRLVDMATFAVICCLTSDKISEIPDTGPCLQIKGRSDIPCYLVTDKELDPQSRLAFQKDNWHVVSNESDWETHPLAATVSKVTGRGGR